jgi:twinkle protein
MLDADETGEQAIAEIVKRLGEERLRIIRIPKPHKDANDLLRAGYGEQELAKLLLHAEHFDPVELIAPSALRDKVMGAGSTNLAPGVDLPWPKTHGDFRMRFGETVIVAGTNGHGKTEFMGNIAAGALSQGARVCAASYEFLPDRYLTRFVRQMVGVEEPTERAKDETLDYLDKRFWLVNARGRDRAKRTIEVFRYAAKRYGVRFFFIDNLSKCGIADDDYQGQKEFTDEVSEFAREMDVIVVLVMHMTKGDESRPATKMQARGSGQITDLADSLLIVWRNKMKEKALQLDGDDKKAREPDCKVICEKQRNGESEPMWALWFDSASHQFIESPQMFPRRYGRAAA